MVSKKVEMAFFSSGLLRGLESFFGRNPITVSKSFLVCEHINYIFFCTDLS